MSDFEKLVVDNLKTINRRLDKQDKRFENIESALLSVTDIDNKIDAHVKACPVSEILEKVARETLEKALNKSFLKVPKQIWYIIGALLAGFGMKYGIDLTGIIPQ